MEKYLNSLSVGHWINYGILNKWLYCAILKMWLHVYVPGGMSVILWEMEKEN